MFDLSKERSPPTSSPCPHILLLSMAIYNYSLTQQIVVYIDPDVLTSGQLPEESILLQKLESLGASHRVESQLIPASITWQRGLVEHDVEETLQVLLHQDPVEQAMHKKTCHFPATCLAKKFALQVMPAVACITTYACKRFYCCKMNIFVFIAACNTIFIVPQNTRKCCPYCLPFKRYFTRIHTVAISVAGKIRSQVESVFSLYVR